MIFTGADVEKYKQGVLKRMFGGQVPPSHAPRPPRVHKPVDPLARTAVYKAFDATGAPLYVGISNHWPKRWVQHADRTFYVETARIEIEWFETREQAERRERELIDTLRPPHNAY